MSQFTPTSCTIEPPATPDFLAGAALEALARPLGGRRSWGLIRTLVLGIPSFGFWPIIMWARRLRQTAIAEQQQYVHLAQWIGLNAPDPLGADLQRQAERVGKQGIFAGFTWVCVVLTMALMAFEVAQASPPQRWLHCLLCNTWGFVARYRGPVYSFNGPLAIFNIWNLGLMCAYACHWGALQGHVLRVRQFVNRFNEMAGREGLTGVVPPAFDTGIRLAWLVAAALLAWKGGAFWAVPMMLAGAAQRRYVRASSTRVRAAMAHRLRAMMLHRRPDMTVPTPVWLKNLCLNSMCRARIPEHANFCPRCGQRAGKQLA